MVSSYDRSELVDSLASFLKSAEIEIPQPTTEFHGFLQSLKRGVVENLASHYSDNPHKSSSVGDDWARWNEFKDFREFFKCQCCGKHRFNRPRGLRKPVCNSCEAPFYSLNFN